MKKYFVVDRHRRPIDIDYVKEFLKQDNIKFHKSFETALDELENGFYDDSDYGVFSVSDNKIIVRET
jgi:hypothetical protein